MRERPVDPRVLKIPSMEAIVEDDPTKLSPSPESPNSPPIASPQEGPSEIISEEKGKKSTEVILKKE